MSLTHNIQDSPAPQENVQLVDIVRREMLGRQSGHGSPTANEQRVFTGKHVNGNSRETHPFTLR